MRSLRECYATLPPHYRKLAQRIYKLAYRRGHYAGTKGAKVRQLERRIERLQFDLALAKLRNASRL